MIDVLVLSHADVHAALAPEACERAMAEVLIAQSTGAAYAPLRSVMIAARRARVHGPDAGVCVRRGARRLRAQGGLRDARPTRPRA